MKFDRTDVSEGKDTIKLIACASSLFVITGIFSG